MKLMVIDGNSIVNRSFYGIRPLTTRDGLYTNAVYGFDATPKTGDPIHPKWFLALGLACVSLILFFKRDKKVAIKAKAA